jgi:aminoglycoside phosphotransferase (APT) family kinase protein
MSAHAGISIEAPAVQTDSATTGYGFAFATLDEFVNNQVPTSRGKMTRTILTGGLSQLTLRYDASSGIGADSIIVKIPPVAGPLEPYDPVREAQTLSALKHYGIAVPDVVFIESSGHIIGRPFYATSFVAGTTVLDGARGATTAQKAVMASHFITGLAQIHSIEPGRDLGGLTLSDDVKNPASLIDRWTKALVEAQVAIPQFHDHLTGWLADRAPASSRADHLVHGDYRLANLLWHPDSSLAAILDWEATSAGDPYYDLGWSLLGTEQPTDLVMGLISRADFLRDYEQASGHEIDRQSLLWWEVMAGWSRISIDARLAALIASGRFRDLRPLSATYWNQKIALPLLRKVAVYEQTYA